MHRHTQTQRSHATPPHAMQGESLLLRPVEAARILAISPRKLWELSNTGEVPTVRIGRSLRYARADLYAWVESRLKQS